LSAEPGGGDGSCRARAAQCFLGLTALEERNGKTGGERVTRSRPVHRDDGRWPRARDFISAL
jgi:hypothetical protein